MLGRARSKHPFYIVFSPNIHSEFARTVNTIAFTFSAVGKNEFSLHVRFMQRSPPYFQALFFFSSSSSIFSMAQVRFKVDVPETLDYTPREAIEDSITLVRGLFTAGWRTTAHA